MADNSLEKRLAAGLGDVAVPPALAPAALTDKLPALARRARMRRVRRISALAAAFVILAGSCTALALALRPAAAADEAPMELALEGYASSESADTATAFGAQTDSGAADNISPKLAPEEDALEEDEDEEEDEEEKSAAETEANE